MRAATVLALAGWRLQALALVIVSITFFALRKKGHPYPLRRAALLRLLLAVGFAAITLAGLPEGAFSL